MANTIYFAWIFVVLFLAGIIFYTTFKNRILESFSAKEIITIFLFVGLLFLCKIPFRIIGGIFLLRAVVAALPYGIVLVIGIRMVPKPGTTTLLICGEAFISQIIATGLNPLWWPMYLTMSFVIEIYCLITKDYCSHWINAVIVGAIKGFLGNFYFYVIGAPFIFHMFYPAWYIVLHIIVGTVSTGVGAFIGYRIGINIIKGFKETIDF